MATSTFERKIEISEKNAMRRFDRVVNDTKMKKPISPPAYSTEDKNRSEQLLKQVLSHSKH